MGATCSEAHEPVQCFLNIR